MAPRGRASAHVGFLVLLALLAVGLAGATLLSYRNAVETAEALLKGQAMDVALAVETGARRSGGDAAALQAILEERRSRGVAYAALVARDGVTLAHTNPPLVGGRLEDGRLAAAVTFDREQTGRLELPRGAPPPASPIPAPSPADAAIDLARGGHASTLGTGAVP